MMHSSLHLLTQVNSSNQVYFSRTNRALLRPLSLTFTPYTNSYLRAEEVAQTGRLLSFDMVEVNPTLNTDPKDHGSSTVQMALALMASALGDTIM
jgi:hypothetical protein